MRDTDLIIVGAGPAGMAAAATAANGGARVLLLDEQPRAGGQIFRNVAAGGAERPYLGKEYTAGKPLVAALDHPNITAKYGATVWRLEAGPRLIWSRDGGSNVSCAPHILLAGGAQERPVPFPGWTLPGVMPAGAAQILMKTAGLLPRDAVLAGSGPLLYLIAAQMIDAGTPPKAMVETQSQAMMLRALPRLPRALLGAGTLIKGLGLIRKIRAAGVARYTGASGFKAATTKDGTIAFSFVAKGREHHMDTPILLTHQGVVPATHLSRAAGIVHAWNEAQQAFQPVVDSWGRTNVSGIHVAGDGAGIGGAEAAQAAGRLVALDVLHLSGKSSQAARDQRSVPERATLRRALAIRPFLDAVYAPLPEFLSPPDDTIVCRCEEVTAGDIRRSLQEGANGLRQVKTATRAGMGPCQGRMCDLTVRGILSSCGATPATPRARSPIKPISLGELAALTSQQETSA
ncbi:FAD-dependent oxidoreductase [Phaeovulum sp.]|uniref:FAD-dependent oxidoreductase n=1 Tax=Phaeovulum sp. TaxID=2934796 RepID=UPI0039E56B23